MTDGPPTDEPSTSGLYEREHEFLQDVDEWLPEVNREYNWIKSEEELVRFVDSKNDDKAAEFLKQGIQHYKCNRHKKALNFLTASIKTAEEDSPIIPVAFGYRANILLSLGYYEDATTDARRALVVIDPDSSFYVHVLSLIETARFFIRIRQNQEEPEERDRKKNKKKQKPLPCARDCVKIASDERYGRHLVATREIQVGEIISTEKPYTGYVNQDTHSYCSECLVFCMNPIPCLECTQVQYCSLKCSELAWRKYHKYECKIKYALEQLPGHNALTVKTVLSLHDYFDEPDHNEGNIYRSDRYKEVLRLCNNKDKMEPEIRRYYAEYAARFFDMVYSQTDFFDDICHERKHDMFKVLAFKTHCISAMNGITVSILVAEEGDERAYRQALYPFTSLYNFACAPNVSLAFHKNYAQMRAIHKIKEGEQLFRPLISVDNLPEADPRDLKRRYCFECDCVSCRGQSPDYVVLELPMTELANFMVTTLDEFNRNWNIPAIGRRLFEELLRTIRNYPDFNMNSIESRYYELLFINFHRGIAVHKDPEGEFFCLTYPQL